MAMEVGITDEGKANGRNPSVMTLVKEITDELLITHRRNVSVGKTVESCSEYLYYYRLYLYRKYCIRNIVYILLCGNLYHCYCILPYTYI